MQSSNLAQVTDNFLLPAATSWSYGIKCP